MAGLDDLFSGDIVTTLAIGTGAVVLGPTVARAAKPLAKMAIRTGFIAYEKGKEIFHDVTEVVGDLVAEANSELAAERGTPLLATAGAGVGVASKASGRAEHPKRHAASVKEGVHKVVHKAEKAAGPKPAKRAKTAKKI